MLKRLPQDVLGALGIAVAAVVYLQEARKLPLGSLEKPDSGFVPLLFGTVLLGLCLILVMGALLAPMTRKLVGISTESGSEAKDENEAKGNMAGKLGSFIGVLVIYPLALPFLGFTLSTIVLLYVSLRVMGHNNRLIAAGISIAAVLLAKFVFEWLGVYFPQGYLW